MATETSCDYCGLVKDTVRRVHASFWIEDLIEPQTSTGRQEEADACAECRAAAYEALSQAARTTLEADIPEHQAMHAESSAQAQRRSEIEKLPHGSEERVAAEREYEEQEGVIMKRRRQAAIARGDVAAVARDNILRPGAGEEPPIARAVATGAKGMRQPRKRAKK